MFKKTLIAIALLLLVVSGSLWWYFRPQQPVAKFNETIRAIPINAAFIVETRHPKSLKQKLCSDNDFWQELTSIDLFKKLDKQINTIDSLLLSNHKINSYSDSISLIISVHPASVNEYSFLFTLSIPPNINRTDIDELIKKSAGNAEIKQRNYDEASISSITLNEGSLNYTVQKNTLLLSFSGMLLEDAIRQLNINNSLLNNPTFERLIRAQSAASDLNLYLNLNLLPGYLDRFINNSHQSFLYSLKYFNDWVVLDGTVKKDALTFNGFSASVDSANNFLNLFKEQEPQRIDMIKIIPENTALLLHFGISNFKTYYNAYKKYLESQHIFFDYQKNIALLKSDYHIDIDRQFLDLIEKEMGLFIKPSAKGDHTSNSYAVFRVADAERSLEIIRELSDSITKKQRLKRDTAMYRGYSILHLPIRNLLSSLLGQSFEPVKENYFTKLDNYLVFANSVEALKNLVNDFENGKTLENKVNFTTLSENFSSESNIFLYSSFNRSTSMIESLLDDHYIKDWENSISTLKNIESFAFQFSSTSTFFYTNAYVKYNSDQNETLVPAWETLLDTTISSAPSIVTNHLTDEKELFIQDDANTIYLISKTGKILWKKHLPEKIISNVYQVDAKKNNKLQMLFNTRSFIYLVDRKGNDVDNFPIELKSPATNSLNVFDYENKREYRILLACENKMICNYGTNGEQVKQWDFKGTNSIVYAALQHINIDEKDYLLIVDEQGKIYALDRQGNERLDLNEKFSPPVKNFALKKGNTLIETRLITCDSSGTIHSINLSGEKREGHLKDFDEAPLFAYLAQANKNGPENIFIAGHELSVFSGKNNLLFNYGFKEPISLAPQVFMTNDSVVKIGVTSTTTGELYLFNSDGIPEKGFPCNGTTQFCIDRLAKQAQPLLICGSHSRVIAYTLPQMLVPQ